MSDWIEKEVGIGSIENLLQNGYEVEVTSPDGWVGVSDFVDKGMHDEYILTCNGKVIRCNGDHLFQTTLGWEKAKDICAWQDLRNHKFSYLCDDGNYHQGEIYMSGEKVPIVDIQVEHDNHRYYTDGISSHNTGVGKSLAMCHFASAALSQGKNVLYITLEMAEERIAERIDANLMDVAIDKLKNLDKPSFDRKMDKIRNKSNGKLIIKEYPTASAHVNHFRALLTELKMKKKFKPDVIYIDYLNICASSRMKGLGNSINTYVMVKAIAEEIRGLAVEFNVPIWSATQVTRSGMNSSDIELTDTSESVGLPQTCDLMVALISTEQLESQNQIMVKQLKNRYNDPAMNKKFAVGVDRSKMRLYDLEDPTHGLIADSHVTPAQAVEGLVRTTAFDGFKV